MPRNRNFSHGAAIVLAVAVLGCASRALAVDTIQPGYWESTNRVTTPIESSKTERRCITAEAVAKFMGCYINHHYACVCPAQSYAAGRILFHGDCVDAKRHHVLIDGEGTYTATTLQMTARGRYSVFGLSIPFSASTDSHRIGDICPAGSASNVPDGR